MSSTNCPATNSINSPAMKKHQLAKLPDLVWPKIFQFLEYDDLLNLVKIYGELKEVISLFVESKTVVINQAKGACVQPPSRNGYLVSKSLIRFRMNSDMHPAIKQLVLYNPLRLYHLRSFDNLISLKIQSTASFRRPNPFMISLKNLQNFRAIFLDDSVSIVLDAPKLNLLLCKHLQLDQLQILHPHSIETVYSQRIRPTVKQMANLKTLYVFNFKISDAEGLLSQLKHLRHFYFYKREDDLNATTEHLRSAQLANPDLEIFYKRININANPLQDAELDETSSSDLDDLSLAVYQKYTDAFVLLVHRVLRLQDFQSFSVELLRKLDLLTDLQVLGEITDDEKWCELLESPDLSRLTIRSAVKQDQLNLIPEHCPFVAFVEIASFGDGDWLLRLKYLEEFRTDVLFDFGLLKKMIQQLYHLKLIKASESYEIRIENGVVECTTNEDVILREPKPVFLQTIELVGVWSEIFHSEF